MLYNMYWTLFRRSNSSFKVQRKPRTTTKSIIIEPKKYIFCQARIFKQRNLNIFSHWNLYLAAPHAAEIKGHFEPLAAFVSPATKRESLYDEQNL
jgi:hypothetical protein